ncbi:MAG TPA: c-type cytochrome [Gallionella sp.]|nr:c-type cytochrome [Gallionella sp.]
MRSRLVKWLLLLWMMACSANGFADEGSDIYRQTCAVCHAVGVSSAPTIPKLGSPDWSKRFAAGRSALLHSVLRGKGAMPPKGGNASLSDAQAEAALDYMLSKIKVKPNP